MHLGLDNFHLGHREQPKLYLPHDLTDEAKRVAEKDRVFGEDDRRLVSTVYPILLPVILKMSTPERAKLILPGVFPINHFGVFDAYCFSLDEQMHLSPSQPVSVHEVVYDRIYPSYKEHPWQQGSSSRQSSLAA